MFSSMLNNYKEQQRYRQEQDLKRQQFEAGAPVRAAQAAKFGAEAERASKQAQLPFGGTSLPGPAGKYMALETIKQQYGEESPQYQQALKAYTLEQDRSQGILDYQASLISSADKRFASPMGKTAMEEQDIIQGVRPGSTATGGEGIPISPERQQELSSRYAQKIIKDTTDPGIRQQALAATNMHNTMHNLPVDDLVAYSGPQGAIELINDKRLSLKGKAPEKLRKYEEAMTASKTLAKQVRQFFKDSITPGVQQALGELTNPTSWLQSPEIAKDKYNKFVDILTTESGNVLKALAGPEVYQGKAMPGVSEYQGTSASKPKDFGKLLVWDPTTGDLK